LLPTIFHAIVEIEIFLASIAVGARVLATLTGAEPCGW